MAYDDIKLLINGEWLAGDGGSEDILNPVDESVIGQCPHASSAQLDAALAASAEGFKVWRATTPVERQKIMEKAATYLEVNVDHIATNLTIEQGKPVGEAKLEIGFAIDVIRWYGEEGKRAYGRMIPSRIPGARQIAIKEPVGPVAAFVAWNFPAVNVIRKVAGAIGAGCSIIIKPSEETPATAIAIARAFQEAGLPNGVLNVVFGVPAEVSEHLIGSPIIKKVSFTGSTPVGKLFQKQAADTLKRCTMELGGHAPFIVYDDADVEKALNAAASFKYRNAGQVCISPTRFFVQEDAYNAFVDGFTERANAVKVGNGLDDGVAMGPLVGERRLGVMDEFVSDAIKNGAMLKTGGARIGNQGFFFQPTVLSDVPDTAKIMLEEPFGPVAPITPFKGIDDVLERANSLPLGLASYVYTRDIGRVWRVSEGIDYGMVGVNEVGITSEVIPFGGMKESGLGREGSKYGIDDYIETKYICMGGLES